MRMSSVPFEINVFSSFLFFPLRLFFQWCMYTDLTLAVVKYEISATFALQIMSLRALYLVYWVS